MSEINEEAAGAPEASAGEETEPKVELVSIPKGDYDKLNQTLGSLKRQVKDLSKPKEEPVTPTTNQPDNDLLQKTFLRAASITAEDEIEFSLTKAQKWNMPLDKLVEDDDFKGQLAKFRSQKANEQATASVQGSGTTGQAKLTSAYWIAKGTPPTPSDIGDRKMRQTIVRDFIKASKSGGKTFYND